MTARDAKAERLAYKVTVILCTAIVVAGTLALYFAAEIFGYDSGLPLWLLGPGVLASAALCVWTGWLLGSEQATSFRGEQRPAATFDTTGRDIWRPMLDLALGILLVAVGFLWSALGEDAPALQLPPWVPPAFFFFLGAVSTLSGILRLVLRRLVSTPATENSPEPAELDRR